MKRTLAVLIALTLPAAAWATIPTGGGTVDLATTFDGKLRGDAELTGVVSAIGDFNGDGGADLAVVQKTPAAVRVVLGGALDGERGFNATSGFTLTSGRALTAVAGAGDVNGDGKADLIVGSCTPATPDAGKAWVVFGRAGTGAINLDAAFGGFAINGSGTECLGRAVNGAGDFNGDGSADVVVGAHLAAANDGRALVVFGKADENPVSSAALGGAGFDFTGPTSGDPLAGSHVAGLGDVNGDGKADVGIGGRGYDSTGYGVDAGAVWVVHGRTGSGVLGLDSVAGSTGFRIDGHADGAHLAAVDAAGDVNKDGKADIVVGAPSGAAVAGIVGVVFGRTSTAPMATGGFASEGYRYTTSRGEDLLGHEVRGGGDLNADGIPDVVAGAPGSNAGSAPERLQAGKVHVLFGRPAGGSVIDVGALGANGVTYLGPRGAQTSVGAQGSEIGNEAWLDVGDVNCDGAADLLVSMGFANTGNGATDPGNVWILRAAGGTPVACAGGTGGGGGGGGGGGAGTTPPPVGTPGPGTGTAPVITSAKLSARKFRVGRRPTAISSARRKTPFGTKIRFKLSEPAMVSFKFACERPRGAKTKKACKSLARKKNTIVRSVPRAGSTFLAFTGRIGKKALPVARFKVTIVAADSDELISKPVTLRFRVVRR